MSDPVITTPEPTPTPTTPTTVSVKSSPFTLSAAKKAYSAGAAAVIVAEGAVIGPVLADGAVSGSEAALIIGTAVVSFVGAFFAAWVPTNG